MTAPEPPSGVAAEPSVAPVEPASVESPPVRATWATKPPEAPWCPAEWLEHLAAVAPGLQPPDATHEPIEATGTRARSATWSLLLASRRGRLHAHRGEHREDAGAMLTFAGGWCAAVADGAGSASWSRLGSAIATHAVTHALRESLLHGSAPASALSDALDQAASAADTAMRRFASSCGLALRDLRTTLLVVVSHGGQLASMQVGDGAMAMLVDNQPLLMPHAGDSGEFSGEVTHFLPDDGAVERLRASRLVHAPRAWSSIIIASDGVDDPWYPFARHAPTLVAQLRDGVRDDNALAAGVTQSMRGPVLGANDPVHALMEWLAFEKRGENDDRTLFVAWVSSPSA